MDRRLYLRFPEFKSKALTLSYDDGVVQDKRLINIMQKNGLKGTFNVNSGLFKNSFNTSGRGRMSLNEAIELYQDSGMEIAVHGYNHEFLNGLDLARAANEVLKDRIQLEKIFNKIIKGMAYAYGVFNDEIVNILKNCGICYSRTVISTESFNIPTDWLRMPTTCHHNNPKLFELLDRFLKPEEEGRVNLPKLFYLWGHSYEFDDNNNWDVIEKFAKISGNRDEVWYATNIEIYNYVTAYDNLEYSVDGKIVRNPSGIDVYVNYYGNNVIPAGKTVIFK